ncbi:MAG: V-type ATP synthase subunit I [Candidatus Thermoplasmatota archaeon]|nr:V-type ATP synthase subunit I [Candidatus Thermoplasmatota archaeon]
MKKTSIVLHQTYAEDVIAKLHEAGLLEITDVHREDVPFQGLTEKTTLPAEVSLYTTYETRLTKLIDILSRTLKGKSGIKALLHPEPLPVKTIHKRPANQIQADVENLFHAIEQTVLTKEDHIKHLHDQKQHLEALAQQLALLPNDSFDVQYFQESPYVIFIAGKTSDLSSIQQAITPQDLILLSSKEYKQKKKSEWTVLIVAHISEKDKIDRLARETLELFDFKQLSGSPTQALTDLQNQQKDLEQQIQTSQSELAHYASQYLGELYALREELSLERIRKEIVKQFLQTHTTYIINGWCLEKNTGALQTLLDHTTHGLNDVHFETPSANPDAPPTHLEIPKWASTFQTFLNLFATPKYNEVNPTIFLGIFFIIFFGLMLGDAGYGLVILLLSLLGYFYIGRHSPFLKNWSFLGVWLGVSTTISGFLMNSFFGDFIPRFIYHDPTRPLYSISLGGIHLPLESLGDPLTILTIALLCGLIHLNLGILLGIVQTMRQKQYKLLITQHFAWIPLQIGGGMLIGVFILKWQINTIMMTSAIILTLLGVILLFIHAGPIGFFGITGYVGDWLSYARILALGLATSGMALAFNVVAELLPALVPVVGIILLPILLVIAHAANLGIQALGAAVHSLRLQYVEFFNRFYEGGGKNFTPFQLSRQYTKVKE